VTPAELHTAWQQAITQCLARAQLALATRDALADAERACTPCPERCGGTRATCRCDEPEEDV
jgi:hypothetical protein